MFPTSRGEVIAISGEKAKVQWIDDNELDVQVVDVTQIHPQGWTSVNGSPIGIFITEDDDSFSEESYREYQKMVADIDQQAQEDALDAEAAGH